MTTYLQKNDLIGLVGLSSPCDPAIYAPALAYLQKCGFRTHTELNPTKGWNNTIHLFSSDTPTERVSALYRLFENTEVKAIHSIRGGYGAMELLSLIDFQRLTKFTKPFIGVSDCTVILNMIAQRTDIPAIHGATFGQGFSKAAVGDSNAQESCDDLFALLSGRKDTVWSGTKHLCGASECEGSIVGGNLSMLSAVIGTPWEPVFDDQLLFIEDIGEKPYRVHRMLMQMKLAGVLDNLKGVVVGEFIDCEPTGSTPASVENVLLDIFHEYGYPVITGAPFGHGTKNLPFRIGATARVEFQGASIKIFR